MIIGRFTKNTLFLFAMTAMVFIGANCAKIENPSSQISELPSTGTPKPPESVYLPDGTLLRFKNDFVDTHKVDLTKNLRLEIESKWVTSYKFKKIQASQSCGDPATGPFGPEVTDPYFDVSLGDEGVFVVCVIGHLQSTNDWLADNRAAFSKMIKIDSTPPTNASVAFLSDYTASSTATAYFNAEDVKTMGFSLISCESINSFVTYKNRFPFNLTLNSSNTIYVKYRDELENETPCVTATIIHDNISPVAPQITAPSLSTAFSRLETEIPLQISCEPQATLKLSGLIVDEAICGISGNYLKVIPTAVLREGDNIITLMQIDRAGNMSVDTQAILKFENHSKGISLPLVDMQVNELAQTVLIPVKALEVSPTARTVEYVIESEDTTNGANYFKYLDQDGVTELTPASYRVIGKVVIPAGQSTANIHVKWLGVAQSKNIAKLRVYLNGNQRRNKRFATDIYVKNSVTTPKLRKLAIGEKVICGLLQENATVPCIGRSDVNQIGSTPGINTFSLDSFTKASPPLDVGVGSQISCILSAARTIDCRGTFYWSTTSSSNEANAWTYSIANMNSLSVGYAHVCGVSDDGVKCWGRPTNGQLGGVSSAPTWNTNPAVVNIGSGLTHLKVTTGLYHTCILYEETATPANKGVKCFGNNIHGQLGLGHLNLKGLNATEMNSLTPVKFKAGTRPVNLYSGGYHNCAILDDNSVSCWGKNTSGQLGLGSQVDLGGSTYTALPTIDFNTSSRVEKLALGESHSCALFEDKSIRCWGDNSYLQLGSGSDVFIGSTPASMQNWKAIEVPENASVVDLVVGGNVSCVLYVDGDARCWGENSSGQRGLPYMRNSNIARPVFGSAHYNQVSTSYNHTCAITQSGKLDCWGLSAAGLLGDGTNGATIFPLGNAESRSFKKVRTGTTISCAQTVENELYCWGLNNHRQLGAGLNVDYVTTPVKVNTSLVFTDFVVGAQHVCGVDSLGDMYCWGANDYGQLGLGDLVSRSVPTKVPTLSNVKKIYAGLTITCATTNTESSLYCWGSNGGLLLNTSLLESATVSVPTIIFSTTVGSLYFIYDVAVYGTHVCVTQGKWQDATKAEYDQAGVLTYCRGGNAFLQIDSTEYPSPFNYSYFRNVSAKLMSSAVGATFTCGVTPVSTFSKAAIDQGGNLQCKGDNTGGYGGSNSSTGTVATFTNVIFKADTLTQATAAIKIKDISAAGTHACGLERYFESPSGTYKNGRLFCWGSNKSGQMGEPEMAMFSSDKTLILKHLNSR